MTALRRVVLLCAVVALWAMVGCSSAQESSSTTTPDAGGPAFADVEPDDMSIGIVAGGEALPLVVADRSGLFREAGVIVTITRFATPAERDAALAAGTIDAIVGTLQDAAALEAAGTPVAMISVLADPARGLESTAAPAAGADTASFGLSGERAYLIVSDYYVALPAGLLGARAVLEASDGAVVRIQADPAAHQTVLAEIVGADVAVAGGAYPPSLAPGPTEVEQQLASLVAAGQGLGDITAADLVLDIGR